MKNDTNVKKIFISTSSFGMLSNEPLNILKTNKVEYELNPYKKTLTEKEVSKFLKEKDGLIAGTEPLTKRVFNKCNSLKVISRVGVGLDNIDIKSAEKKDIKVYNTPYGPTKSVSELTLGMILNILRSVSYSDREIRKGIWNKC